MKDIKKTYHDALFFASSPSNKKENFYLTPSEFKVLIKLMVYQRNNSDITYQNKTIAEHIFLAESTVKDAMEALARMAYISTELNVFNNGLGFKSKRTVRINWKRIEEIDNKIPTEKEAPESKIPTESIPEVQVEVIIPKIEDNTSIDRLLEFKTKWEKNRNGFDYVELIKFDNVFKTTDYSIKQSYYKLAIDKFRMGGLSFEEMINELNKIININELV
jgi:DNA-binding MarR family transcriptional regulator